jgi:predicted MFS family arabinose efflux permease
LGIQLTLRKPIQAPPPVGLRQRLVVLKNTQIALVLLASLVMTVGGFTVYNYIAPILHEITHIQPENMSWLLLLFGISSIVGNIVGGYSADRFGSITTLRVSIVAFGLCLMAFSLLMMIPVDFPIVWTCTVVIVWGIAAWALNPPLNSFLISLAPNAATVVLSLSASVLYLGIGLAAMIGGLVMEYISVKYLGFVAGLFEVFSLGILFLCSRSEVGNKKSLS